MQKWQNNKNGAGWSHVSLCSRLLCAWRGDFLDGRNSTTGANDDNMHSVPILEANCHFFDQTAVPDSCIKGNIRQSIWSKYITCISIQIQTKCSKVEALNATTHFLFNDLFSQSLRHTKCLFFVICLLLASIPHIFKKFEINVETVFHDYGQLGCSV